MRFAKAASRYASIDAAQTDLDWSLRVAGGGSHPGGPQDSVDHLARGNRRGTAGAEMTTKADHAVDRAADHLQEMADKAAAEGGLAAKFAQNLADDADFLRKLKPSLMRARAKGMAPTHQKPSHGTVKSTSKRPKSPGQGPSPFLIIGLAFAVGIAVAKFIDWKNDANPDD
jgi:hypothetical protein